ncbi:23739_t:CDS:2, partial [Gigaspora rosea]
IEARMLQSLKGIEYHEKYVELNLPLTCQQPSAMLDSSEGSIFKLLFLRIKRIVRPSKKQKSAMELNDKQPLNTINENLNQSNYEQLNLEE